MPQIEKFSVTKKSELSESNQMQLTTLNQDKERSDKNKKNDGLNIINNITNNYIYLNK